MRVAVLGPKGTYTHAAADEYFESYDPVFCAGLAAVFDAEADARVVPFENSLGGGVSQSIDLLRERDVEITGELLLPIEHCLCSREADLSTVRAVRSHPQALSQCRSLIEEHGWETIEAPSTAAAARDLEPGEAAIASTLAAREWGLQVHAENVQDVDSNVTRFLVLDGPVRPGEKTSMILEPGEDRPGILRNMLGCYSGHGINLSYIQSRPTGRGLGEYYFYIEAEAGRGEDALERALQCVRTYANVNVLGSYPRGTLRENGD